MKQMIAAVLASLACAPIDAAQAASGRVRVDLQCESSGSGPRLDCLVRLHAPDGAPLEGARVTLGATMPSMPMAHSVAPAGAQPGDRPGEYRGQLLLEMPGTWAVQVDVAGPVRERAVRTLRVEGCQTQRRCPAAAAAPDRGQARAHPHAPAH